MNNLKTMTISGCVALSLLATAWATPAPSTCPTVPAIQNAGLLRVSGASKEDSLYYAYQIGQYNTQATWVFAIGVPFSQATSNVDAMNKAKAALATLQGSPAPVATDEKNEQWVCFYGNNLHYLAVAITPIAVSNTMMHTAIKLNPMVK